VRNTFLRTLVDLAESDEKIWLLTADLGFSVVEPFVEKFPKRFLNVGVAEQNMAGVAAGLAMSGKTVFIYSIANFPTLRCLEQIRNDICYHNANVKIVAVGAGISYGTLGYTHHGVEDVGILRTLPNLMLATPADPKEAIFMTRFLASTDGPAYLRLEKNGEPVLHQDDLEDFIPGKPLVSGSVNNEGVVFISYGSILKLSLDAAEALRDSGIPVTVISLPALRPMDTDSLLSIIEQNRLVVAVEEHRKPAPLQEMLCTLLNQAGLVRSVLGVNLGEAVMKGALGQAAYRVASGLTPDDVVSQIRAKLGV
jgi:transketolase